jgi:hypothetical protein
MIPVIEIPVNPRDLSKVRNFDLSRFCQRVLVSVKGDPSFVFCSSGASVFKVLKIGLCVSSSRSAPNTHPTASAAWFCFLLLPTFFLKKQGVK